MLSLGILFLSLLAPSVCAQAVDGPNDLVIAVAKGDASKAAQALSAGSDPNARYRGAPLLYWAATGGDAAITTLLLDKGADPNAKSDSGQTPLLQSVFGANSDVARALLDHGADPNERSNDGNTALLYATFVATADPGYLLRLTQGRHPGSLGNAQISRMQAGALKIAALLLERGAQPNAQDAGGRTALMSAASGGNMALAQALLGKGADPNLRDNNHATALGFAAVHGRADVAALLIRRGADINAKDTDGKTALMLASEGRHAEVARVLQDAGATELAATPKDAAAASSPDASLHSLQAQRVKELVQDVYDKADAALERRDLEGALAYVGPAQQREGMREQLAAILPRARSVTPKTRVGSVLALKDAVSATVIADHHLEFETINPATGEPGVLSSDERDEEVWTKTDRGWRKQQNKNLSMSAAFKKKSASGK